MRHGSPPHDYPIRGAPPAGITRGFAGRVDSRAAPERQDDTRSCGGRAARLSLLLVRRGRAARHGREGPDRLRGRPSAAGDSRRGAACAGAVFRTQDRRGPRSRAGALPAHRIGKRAPGAPAGRFAGRADGHLAVASAGASARLPGRCRAFWTRCSQPASGPPCPSDWGLRSRSGSWRAGIRRRSLVARCDDGRPGTSTTWRRRCSATCVTSPRSGHSRRCHGCSPCRRATPPG